MVDWDFQMCEEDLGGESIPTFEDLERMGIPHIGPGTGPAGAEPLFENSGPILCQAAFGDLYEAYALTGDEGVFDLLSRFVRATASDFEGESQSDYLQALADVPTRMEKQIHDWYWIRDR